MNPNTCCDGAIWTLNESPSEKEGKSVLLKLQVRVSNIPQ